MVEGLAAGRNVIGNDLNSLAVFITKVKITILSAAEVGVINEWVLREVPNFNYHHAAEPLIPYVDQIKTKNMSLVKARFIKKAVAAALASIANLPTENARNFAKCIVLRVGQWALDGRVRHTSLSDFRQRLSFIAKEMIESIVKFSEQAKLSQGPATILNMNAAQLDHATMFNEGKQKVSLVVTSPPYPGVHVLYHRWQVNGRRETPAPYWIAGCNDGQGASFYNFGDRDEAAADTYSQDLVSDPSMQSGASCIRGDTWFNFWHLIGQIINSRATCKTCAPLVSRKSGQATIASGAKFLIGSGTLPSLEKLILQMKSS